MKTDIQVTLYGLSRLYLGMWGGHTIHMHAITVNERRGYEFEGEWEGVYGTLWREKKQGIKVLILL